MRKLLMEKGTSKWFHALYQSNNRWIKSRRIPDNHWLKRRCQCGKSSKSNSFKWEIRRNKIYDFSKRRDCTSRTNTPGEYEVTIGLEQDECVETTVKITVVGEQVPQQEYILNVADAAVTVGQTDDQSILTAVGPLWQIYLVSQSTHDQWSKHRQSKTKSVTMISHGYHKRWE